MNMNLCNILMDHSVHIMPTPQGRHYGEAIYRADYDFTQISQEVFPVSSEDSMDL